MAVTQTNAIIFLDRQFFDYYAPNLQTPLRFMFTPETVQHMDILSKDTLTSQLETFITSYKLLPSSITLLLSDHMLFCKELTVNSAAPTETEETQSFLDLVPFENVLSKLYRLEKKEILVTTNQAFIDMFQNIFSKHNSRIDICVPIFLLGKSVNIEQGLTSAQGKLILEHLGNIKPWTMPISQEVALPEPSTPSTPSNESNNDSNTDVKDTSIKKEKPSKTRIYAMVGVFAVLVVIMVFMLFQMNAQNAKDAAATQANKQAALAQQNQPQQTDIPTPTAPIAETTPDLALPATPVGNAFTATADEQKITLAIQSASDAASASAQIQSVLTTFGIKNITTSQVDNQAGSQNLVLFNSTVSKASQQRILSQIQQIVPDMTSEENDQLSVDALVLLK